MIPAGRLETDPAPMTTTASVASPLATAGVATPKTLATATIARTNLALTFRSRVIGRADASAPSAGLADRVDVRDKAKVRTADNLQLLDIEIQPSNVGTNG